MASEAATVTKEAEGIMEAGADIIAVFREYVSSIQLRLQDERLAQGFDGLSSASLVVFFLVFVASLVILFYPQEQTSKKEKRSSSTRIAKQANATPVPSDSKVVSSNGATAKPKPVAEPLAPSTPSVSAPVSPVSAPASPPSTSREAASCSQVLHSGVLKKHHTITKRVNKFELYQEDEKNIAIFYAGTLGSSPSSSRSSSSLYLAGESHIEPKSKTSFTVHQLKSGGKKLTLEAKTAEEREAWIQKIQAAIDSLKLQSK